MKREICVASLAGFCFGVRRAVEHLEELLATKKDNETVGTLGHLIHNERVIEDFASRGVRLFSEEDLADIYREASPEHPFHILIRTHGTEKKIWDTLTRMAESNPGVILHDMTCPFVKKIHRIVIEETTEEKPLVVFGNSEHPEVRGIVSYAAGPAYVVSGADRLGSAFSSLKEPCVVAQTTQSVKEWKKIELFFEKYCTNAKIFATICSVTESRQKEAAALAAGCDLMVVVGGTGSANTRSLYETVKKVCPQTFLVEGADGLPSHCPKGCSIIGITAGASTPRYIIEEVKQKMSEIKEVTNEENFAELLEGSLKTLNTGDIVTGVITSISATEIHVDLSTKGTGILPVDELPLDPETNKPMFKVGDEIEAFVVRVSDVEGVVGLSRKKIERMSQMKKLAAAEKDGTVLTGKVTEVIKGGVIITAGYSRVFIPASQTGVPKDGDLSTLVGTTQDFVIISVEENRNHAVGSIRAVLRARKKEAQDAFWNTVEEGMKFTGKVKSLTSYGAFVDLGGVDGMVHISELTWSKIHNPAEVVSVGDTLSVYVKGFDKEKKRVSLGCKTEENNPWNLFTAQYQEGDVATVTIVNLTPFGAFAEIIPEVDGLIHISQIADRKIGDPAEYLTKGQQVEAKIIGIDNEKQKVSLSIRALLASEEETATGESSDSSAEDAAE